MDVPENLDAFLAGLLQCEADREVMPHVELDADQRAFIERIIEAVTIGSKGIFIVLHPDERLQYMLLDTCRVGALSLLATVMQRTADDLEVDVDSD